MLKVVGLEGHENKFAQYPTLSGGQLQRVSLARNLVFSSKITTKMVRKYNKESREMNGKILSFYSESIQNLQTIKAFDITKRYVE